MLRITSSGSFKNTQRFLQKMSRGDMFRVLDSAGARGVSALRSATPVDSGLSAESWSYEVKKSKDSTSIYWINTHRDPAGVPVVILLQYGHGTGTGGYVQGHDFINPALKPIFDKIADDVWKAVTSA